MKQKLLLLFFFNGSWFFNAYSLEVNSKNIKSLIEQKNVRISASEWQIQAAKEREGILARSFFPSVKLSAAQENFTTGQNRNKTQPIYGIEGDINLFNAGKDKIESEIRDTTTRVQATYNQQTIYTELQKARSYYWEILYLKSKKDILTAAIEINKSNSLAAERRIKSGVATQTDRVEFEMEAINLQRELQLTDVQFKNNINMLKITLNLEESENFEFQEVLVHEHDFETMMNHTVKDFEFSFKDAELNAKINSLQSDKQRRAIWPRVDAFASYYQYNQREKDFLSAIDRDEYTVGIKVTIDIPAGLESNRDAAAYHYQAKSAQNLAIIRRREIETHLKNEMNELNYLHDQVHNAEENIKHAEKYYRLTQSEYNRGVKNSPDVLGASQRLLAMRHKRLEIVKDFQLSKGHILSQLGK